ncbi:hypothetical protein [Paenibacillus durus]|uniref:Uncharacterized protein n=1 Tax=Paenibacillus durus TaxID=44251 RepID=A0A089HLD9_PAEDU|nr:hypothetical protein [Paenibacillus durus]AIQ11505.1 hypothetical protein PDUR_05730 [Paenibacillus durus]
MLSVIPETMLDVIKRRFGVEIDPDSSGGQILNSLRPRPPFDDQMFTGQADLSPLTLTFTNVGLSVHAAQVTDALVFTLPAGPLDFKLVPPDAAHPKPQVELKLVSFTVPLPYLRPAQVRPDGTLQESAGKVELHFPDLLLVVAGSSAKLAPSDNATAALEVTMTPALALFGPSTVVGLGFDRATLKLEGPGAPELFVPAVEIYVSPPALPALAIHGGGRDLHLGLSGSGLSGDFSLGLVNGAQTPQRPRFLRNMAAHLRLHRNSVTLLELTGQIDLQGELKALVGLPEEPSELIDYVLSLMLDGGWKASLSLKANGNRNYLWRTQRPVPNPDEHDLPRDTLGAYAVFSPLLIPNLPGAGSSGYIDLGISAGAASAIAASQSVSTQSVTLYGGQLVIRQPVGAPPEAFLFFDLETELHFKMKVGAMKLLATRRPLKVRQRAIGLRLDFGPGGAPPQFKPVFDPAQGFSLDLSDPGLFEVPAPLGDIVQPEGARMARENPLNFEIDLVLKADLGVVTVDRASVRIPIDSSALPTLTALGAHINVPGALSGSGYLKLLPNGGFTGCLDAAVAPPFGVRVASGLSIENARDITSNEKLTSVMVKLGVELPVPIPLANSGLGLFGLLGMFGMHFKRNQLPSQTALNWFVDSAQGDATNINAWKASSNAWALGLGAVIGTVEGGFLTHAKGMVVIELPGPRLLLVTNADLLKGRPATKGTETGKFLAIIDIQPDQSLTMGIVVDYGIKPLLEFRVPVEAYFDFKQPENWHLDVGGIPPRLPASVKFLNEMRADGYLLIHGNGIPSAGDLTPPSQADFSIGPLYGFSVAAGVRAAFTWGPEEIGLYLKIAAQIDVGISFKPFLIIGKMSLRGELHLFIVSVEASASAEVIISPVGHFISAEVCGSVDFFFFDVEGCVKLELGERPGKPPAEPLVRALSLHSRSPALLTGSAVDRPVDGSLGNAAYFAGNWVGKLPVVPVDSIPVLQMEMRPCVDAACRFFNRTIDSKLPPNGWVRRGERFYRYTLKSIQLICTSANGAPLYPPVDEGDTPAVWWDRYGKPSGGGDNEVQLALLSWIPDATPAAAERTTSLDQRVKHRWGNMCMEVAPPTKVLWTFRQAPGGPSMSGWRLQGLAWPDEPGTFRSMPPETRLQVTEPWRSDERLADGMILADPAYICSRQAEPGRLLVAPHTGIQLRPAVPNDHHFDEMLQALRPGGLGALADAIRLNCGGLRAVRLLLFVHPVVWRHEFLLLRALDKEGNPNGFEQAISPDTSRVIAHIDELPSDWNDSDAPWKPLTEGACNFWFHSLSVIAERAKLVLYEADLPDDTAQIEIGLSKDFCDCDSNKIGLLPNWGLLIIEGLLEAEFLRFSYDKEAVKRNIDVVNGALGADQGKRALLRPDAIYTVDLTYDVEVADNDGNGNPKEGDIQKQTGQRQQFRFKTDTKPPERLDPWVLATDPGPVQNFFFYGDPLRVVFATNATRKLFKVYNQELFAVVKAASGKHPQAAPGFDAAVAKLGNSVFPPLGIAAVAMTPFESSLREALAGQPCLNVSNQTAAHERVTLKMKLEPLTDYILDLEARPSAAAPVHPMFRRHFSTSRYESMEALAADVNKTQVQHRRIASTAPLAMLAAQNPGPSVLQVSDLDIENALRRARWGDLARLVSPHLTVIWKDGALGTPPQPFALLIETTEPLWRWRDVPQEVTDSHGTRRYQLQPVTWLDVIETPAGVRLVSRFVRSSGGGRTLVVLKPSARGGTLSLALRRTYHILFEGYTAVKTASLTTVSLAMAPWEDQS